MELIEAEETPIRVMEGYKKTEVGIIPDDWVVKELGTIGNFKNGINKSKEDFGFGFPFVNLLDVFGKPTIENNNNFGLINSNEIEQQIYDLRKGDVIFIRSSVKPSGVGLTSLIQKNLLKTVYSGFLIRFRDSGFLNNEFKAHCFYEEGFRNRLISASTVSANTNINQEALKKLLIAFPPTNDEQKAIAKALSDVDALISNLEKLITKKKAIKQGAMQQLLKSPKQGGKRLAGFEGDWEEKRLGDIGDCIIGLTYKPENVCNSGTLVLRSSNIQNNTLSYLDNVYVNIDIPEKLRTKEGDILICVRNGSRQLIGKCVKIDKKASGETFGAFMSIFRTPYSDYVAYAFQSEIIKRQIDENLGATINQITNKMLNSFVIPFPPVEEQKAIAKVLNAMDFELKSLEKKKVKYQSIKQGMMQELLTGKTRLV